MFSAYKSTEIGGHKHNFCIVSRRNDVFSVDLVKEELIAALQRNGLAFRYGTDKDISRIAAFQKALFDTSIVSVETEYELFRILRYGYVLLLENGEGDIAGFYTMVQYNTRAKDAYGIRVGVLPEVGGYNYAALLAKLAILIAYGNGCHYFRALMSPLNYRAASNVLNHVGYYCEEFHADLPGFGIRFAITLPLSPDVFNNSGIDLHKIIDFAGSHRETEDYHLIRSDDFPRMELIYKATDFKIIAFLREGLLGPDSYFFAIKQIL